MNSVCSSLSSKHCPINYSTYDPSRDHSARYQFNLDTFIGRDLNASRISIAGRPEAIVAQNPRSIKAEKVYLRMLAVNRTPVVMVIDTKKDMKNDSLEDFFTQDRDFGDIKITQEGQERIRLGDGAGFDQYLIKIEVPEEDECIPVIVLQPVNRLSSSEMHSANLTTSIGSYLNKQTDEMIRDYKKRSGNACDNSDKLLPVLTSKSGCHSTGQILAAMQMKKQPLEISLEEICTQICECRSKEMYGQGQIPPLSQIAQGQNRPLVKPDVDIPSIRYSEGNITKSTKKLTEFKDSFPDTCKDAEYERFSRIKIAGSDIAITAPSPSKKENKHIKSHLDAVINNKTPVLVELSSKYELNRKQLARITVVKDWLCNDLKHGSKFKISYKLEDGVIVNKFEITGSNKGSINKLRRGIRGDSFAGGKDICIRYDVFQVEGWHEDKTLNPSILYKLSKMIIDSRNKKELLNDQLYTNYNDPNEGFPVIQSAGDDNRNVTLVATMAMQDKDALISLEKILRDICKSHSKHILPSESQLKSLVEISEYQNRPLFIETGGGS